MVKSESQSTNDYSLDDNDMNEEVDMIAKLNHAFKTMEIIGQILKNYYGSIKGTQKLDLCEEAYSIGLRSLNVFLSKLSDEKEMFVRYIKEMIISRGIEEHKIEDKAKIMLFNFCSMIAYIFIKKISNSVGSENLVETFRRILQDNSSVAIQLIDISIKLDHFNFIPYREIDTLQKNLKGNLLGRSVLQKLVYYFLYMFETSYIDKQKICESVGISIETQRLIELSSSSKKSEKKGRRN